MVKKCPVCNSTKYTELKKTSKSKSNKMKETFLKAHCNNCDYTNESYSMDWTT